MASTCSIDCECSCNRAYGTKHLCLFTCIVPPALQGPLRHIQRKEWPALISSRNKQCRRMAFRSTELRRIRVYMYTQSIVTILNLISRRNFFSALHAIKPEIIHGYRLRWTVSIEKQAVCVRACVCMYTGYVCACLCMCAWVCAVIIHCKFPVRCEIFLYRKACS